MSIEKSNSGNPDFPINSLSQAKPRNSLPGETPTASFVKPFFASLNQAPTTSPLSSKPSKLESKLEIVNRILTLAQQLQQQHQPDNRTSISIKSTDIDDICKLLEDVTNADRHAIRHQTFSDHYTQVFERAPTSESTEALENLSKARRKEKVLIKILSTIEIETAPKGNQVSKEKIAEHGFTVAAEIRTSHHTKQAQIKGIDLSLPEEQNKMQAEIMTELDSHGIGESLDIETKNKISNEVLLRILQQMARNSLENKMTSFRDEDLKTTSPSFKQIETLVALAVGIRVTALKPEQKDSLQKATTRLIQSTIDQKLFLKRAEIASERRNEMVSDSEHTAIKTLLKKELEIAAREIS